ncbi:tyrosine-protein phosphatase [Aeromicrobium sp. UC242_57]|uniref:tyrosine-protein phosphatase n=1 Tax=Aeromicrobium sp. UC242_57 TaxID=3374624 RepID=UPI0037A9CAB1
MALLLRLVGVPRETVLEEYLLTNQALAAIDARLRPAAPRRSGYAYPAGYAHVSSEAIDGVLDVWDTHDGGVHGWFEAAGGHERDIEQLHRTLLV